MSGLVMLTAMLFLARFAQADGPGTVQVITNPNPGACGAGSADGHYQETLPRLSGTLKLESERIVEVSTDRNNNSCVTIEVLFKGGAGRYQIAVNGTNIPYRGPHLVSRLDGEFGQLRFDVIADCGRAYTLNTILRSDDGQESSFQFTEIFPCAATATALPQPTATATALPTATAKPKCGGAQVIGTGPDGGTICINPRAHDKECGFGFYDGEYDPPLARLANYGKLNLISTNIRDIELDPVVGTCLTIVGTFTGSRGPWRLAVNGTDVPYLGPHLMSVIGADYGYWGFNVIVECNQSYRFEITQRSNVNGESSTQVINQFVPCQPLISGRHYR